MKGMIFSAGLGTRLSPITQTIPKALVEINGKTLLQIVIEKLLSAGIDEIIVNVHHFAEQITSYLSAQNNFGAKIKISDERDELLETGGGLKKASTSFKIEEPILIHNVDIISNIDLNEFIDSFNNKEISAMLAVQKRKSSRKLLFNKMGILCGWKNLKTGEIKLSRDADKLNEFSFSGIQIIHPRLFQYFPEKRNFSIIDLYLNAAEFLDIKAYQHNNDYVYDVGKIEDLKNLPF